MLKRINFNPCYNEMKLMNNFAIYNDKTKENKKVIVDVHPNGNTDSILANNIILHIKKNMDMNYTILNSDPWYQNVSIIDSNNVTKVFTRFLLWHGMIIKKNN